MGSTQTHNRYQLRVLMQKYNQRCQWCNCPVRKPSPNQTKQNKDDASRDHIIPQCDGGKNTLNNLTLSCSRCNHHRGNNTVEFWLMRIEKGLYDVNWWHKLPRAYNRHLELTARLDGVG